MRKFLLFTTTGLIVALGMKAAFANPAHHPNQPPHMMHGEMMSEGMAGNAMMSGGMMGGGMMNPDMMIVMLDTDGDGSLSLEEFQNLHARMFSYMDKNKDGKLEASELAAHHAGGMNAPDGNDQN
nr:EF-hand domain-containing protein [uncultured Cohaesibacter sp.]